ncbi:MAG: fatty acid--CoA ligase [Pseudomonadota bacterium]
MDHALDIQYETLAEMLPKNADAYGDKIALEFEDERASYRDLDMLSDRVADALLAAGLNHGDRIAYLGKNSLKYFLVLMGCARIGVVMVPVNWRLAGPEISFIIDDAGARLLFVGSEFTDEVNAMRDALPGVERFVSYESDAPDMQGWEAFVASGTAGPERAKARSPIDPHDVIGQMYTSGTTGRPKGVMITHFNLTEPRRVNGEAQLPWNMWSDDDVSVVGMPLFHIGGTAWALTGMMAGAKGIITREFNPVEIMDLIAHRNVSKIFLVPAAIQFILNHPKVGEIDFSRIKYILYGASPIPLDLLRQAMTQFGCGFVQVYGMTETAGSITALPPEDHDPEGNERMRSAGKAMPAAEVGIMDEDGNLLPPGEVGEIVCRSCSNMKGYWNRAEATAATLTGDGWLHTGDAGRMDEDGYVYILDRVKDMVISGGENIYPAEVESALYGHPEIADVGVIGVPDEDWGEAVKAVVVRKDGSDLSEGDVVDYARTQIARFKCPRSVDFVDELPRNPSGKILRRLLREPYWEGRERGVN